jgi:hypothetical protein
MSGFRVGSIFWKWETSFEVAGTTFCKEESIPKATLLACADSFGVSYCLLIGGRMPKQSSSLSLPREMAGDEEVDELELGRTEVGSWLWMIPWTICRYSSSILVDARRAAV